MSGVSGSRWSKLTGDVNRLSRNLGAPRRFAIRAYSTALRANVFLPPPKVLLNGPGKSGTHLAADCLNLMPKMMFSGRHFALQKFVSPPDDPSEAQSFYERPDISLYENRLDRFIGNCPNGMFITSHARFHPVMRDILQKHDVRQLLLLRDPRDLVISYVFFVQRERLHPHHDYFTKFLKTDDERIMATIKGFEYRDETGGLRKQASMKEIFDGFIAWDEDPVSDTLLIKFENLAGVSGGRSEKDQSAEIEKIADFVERGVDGEAARNIATGAYGNKNLTFRKGLAGEWRTHFGAHHRSAFEDSAGDVLVRLGYDRD